jgi:cytochrome c553
MMNKKMLVALAAALISGGVLAAGDPAAGKEKAQQVCAACHGADGNSVAADFPKLAGQHADYLVAALHQYKSGKRKNAIMAGFAGTLSDKDMVDLAAYFSSQSGLSLKY